MSGASTRAEINVEIASDMGGMTHDPLGYVLYAYPWGSGELTGEAGPRDWQRDVLRDIGDRLAAGYDHGGAIMPVLKAISSGHGIGKSALIAWLDSWARDTCEDTKVLITANTGDQLKTKTWPEIAKWHRMSITRHWWTLQGLTIVSRAPGHSQTWRTDAVTWSEDRTQAFAGLHNKGKRIVLLMDEASGIADKVWEVAEGALTDADTEIVWIAFGNPTEPMGSFQRCFGAQRERWHGQQIDSRTVPGTNHALFEEWVALYGEDSDFVRVRVRGMFPRSGETQFIGTDLADGARSREAVAYLSDALVIGVDVARSDGAGDKTVIYFRKGRDGRAHPPIKLRSRDTMIIAARVADEASRYRADAVFVDGGGVGGGVVDRCRQIGVVGLIEVQFGAAADRITFDETRPAYANKRAEMWGNMRDWLKGGAIVNDPELIEELTGPRFSYVIRDGRDAILLEPKAGMKLRGLSSPDIGDALALTFAYPVNPRANAGRAGAGAEPRVITDYDPFAVGR